MPGDLMEDLEIEGYASLFWTRDLNEDVTAAGAFGESLARTGLSGVKMLFQHEADEPIGVWDEIVEDAKGLYVRGRILSVTPQGRMVAALVKAGALDGLSIGFRTVKARPDESGRLRVLTEVELWEVSIVTFPMLPGAKITTINTGAAEAA
jgi:HK97 family phage prohead protease